MTSANDLRILDTDELESRLAETRQELFNLRFQRVTGQLDNTARLRELRREVARMKTIAREREIAEAEGEEAAPPAPARPAQAPPTPGRLDPSVVADAEAPPLPVAERVEADEADELPDEDEPEEDASAEDDEPEEAP